MPIYEYVCRSCESEFEELSRSMERPQKVRCPSCGSTSAARRLSVFAARQGQTAATSPVGPGPCGRCGDPAGPCSM